MNKRTIGTFLFILLILAPSSVSAAPDLTMKTIEEWAAYVKETEKRIDSELGVNPVRLRSDLALLKSGKIQTQQLTTAGTKGKDLSDGTIHHWFGAVFIPNTTVDKVVALVQDYSKYPDYFKDVEKSGINERHGDEFEIFLRLTRSKLGVTAHFNTTHKVVYDRKSSSFVTSVSRSQKILQVKGAGTAQQSEYPEGKDSGYLWRLNSYWRFIERDKGVVVECETIGLSRSLNWGFSFLNILTLGKVQGIAESIAREALESTLTDLRDGVVNGPRGESTK